ncbi:DUF4435 domain-containing protein [Methanococcoides sp. FTZ1]|uniref:DUF4435 domain-containing protein n=1 Tax=Methanococcoides sp. FTZ1 TaxID=3439061 RepID=UPI003F87A555
MKKYLTADDIANSARMMRTQYRGTIMIIEGSTDMRLYKRFVDDRKCRLIPANGKENAIKVVEILERSGFEGILTIVDADFWRLDNIDFEQRNVLVTDTHDLETMIIASEALDRLLEEFAAPFKLQKMRTPVRELLLEAAMPIGLFRWLSSSSKDKLSLRFKDIHFDNFMEVFPLSVNIKYMIREVKENSHEYSLNEKKVKNEIITLLKEEHDPWQACSGHDMVEILAYGLREVFGNSDSRYVTEGIIDRSLRLSYDITMFRDTELYRSIQEWEDENPAFTVLQ